MRQVTTGPFWVAILKVLREAGINAYELEVSDANPSYPYAIISGDFGIPDTPALGAWEAIDATVSLTLVHNTPNNLRVFTAKVRDLLSGGLTIAGWATNLDLYRVSPALVDRSVTITETGRHPAYTVETWRIRATPIDEEEAEPHENAESLGP